MDNKLGKYVKINQGLLEPLQRARVDKDSVSDGRWSVSGGKNTEQSYWFNIDRLAGKASNYYWLILVYGPLVVDSGGTIQELPEVYILSNGPQKRSQDCLYDFWMAGNLTSGSLVYHEVHHEEY